jgi:iron complex outermembrane recepter protein
MKTFYLTNLFLIIFLGQLKAQLDIGYLEGKVLNADNQPIMYINVAIKNTKLGTATDQDGKFKLKVPYGKHILMVSGVGVKTWEQEIQVSDNQLIRLEIKIEEDDTILQEVVVRDLRAEQYVVENLSPSLRLNVPILEVPQNISVVTQQAMRDFGVVGTAEMSRMTSGIIKRYGGANDFAFTIRGTDATNNVFRNGVGSYWWNQQSDAFMLDRVEFVKGPAGFMIGNAEPGGLLNEVTKQADGQRVREVQIGYGSWNLLRAGVDLGGKFSQNSKFSYRIVAGGQRTNANYDFYKATRTYLVSSLRYTYQPNSFIQLEINRMDGHVRGDSYNNISFTGQAQDMIFPIQFNATDPNAVEGIETDDTYLRLSHTHQLSKGWQIKTQIARVNGIYRGSNMYVSNVTANFDSLYREVFYMNWRNRLTAAQTFIDGKFKTGNRIEHSILSGLDYGNTRVVSAWGEFNPDAWGTQFPIAIHNPIYNLNKIERQDFALNPDDDWGTEWLAWYTQDHIKLYDKVVLTLAGRLSRTKSWASWDSTTVRDTKFTPRLGLTYLINPNMSIYALYDETFLPQTGRKADRSLPTPLSGTNIELGYKSQLFKQRLALNASLFRTIKNNVLVQNPLTSFYEERGQITSQGFEMDMTGNVSKSLIVNINYTFTDARVTQDADPEIVGFVNYSVARHTGNAMIRYKFIDGKLSGFSMGVGAQLVGDRSAVWAGFTEVQDKDKFAPSYTIFDANVGYETPKFWVMLNVFNLLNKRYMNSAWWNSAVVDEENPANNRPGYFTFAPSEPTNFRVSTGYKF